MNRPDPEMLRAIPLEALRQWYLDRIELSSIRDVADLCGVGRSTLHKFVIGQTHPHPRIRRLLALYYVMQQDDDNAAHVREARAAFKSVLSLFPEADREWVLGNLLGTVERYFQDNERKLPPWAERLRDGSLTGGHPFWMRDASSAPS